MQPLSLLPFFLQTISWLELLIGRLEQHSPTFHYDKDHSIQAVDPEIKISKAGSSAASVSKS